MPEWLQTLLIASIPALLGFIGLVYKQNQDNAKAREDRANALSEEKAKQRAQIDELIQRHVDRLERHIEELEERDRENSTRIAALEQENRQWREGALILFRQALREGRDPEWTPPEVYPKKPGPGSQEK